MPSKFTPKETKDTPAKQQPTKKELKFLPIVFTSQMARTHIEGMNAKVSEIKNMYPSMFTPPRPTIPQPPEVKTTK